MWAADIGLAWALLCLIAGVGLAWLLRQRWLAWQADRQAVERFELALAGADLGLWDWDVRTGRLTNNARWLSMLGYSAKDTKPHYQWWVSKLHPEDRGPTLQLVESHLKGLTPEYRAEFRMQHADGRWVWIRARGRIMSRTPDGKPIRFLGTHADITDDKTAQEALRQSEARARALFNHLPAGAVVHAPDTRILAANPQACRILGLSEEQMLGREAMDPRWALIDESEQPLLVSQYPVNKITTHPVPFDGFVVGVRRPGEVLPRWVICSGYPVFAVDGSLEQAVITFVDITDYKAAQEALRRHAN